MAKVIVALALFGGAVGASECEDSTTWHKNGTPSKDCAWVASYAVKRCMVKGVDRVLASEECKVACGSCEVAEAAPVLHCVDAEPQSPRDVSEGYVGTMDSRVDPLGFEVIDHLVHVNTHFHLGAEHRSEGEYDLQMPEINVGWYCHDDHLTEAQLEPYEFQWCHDVHVGETHEFHWVHSSAGVGLGPGLGGAFASANNPFVAVQAQVFLVVNDDDHVNDDLLHHTTFSDDVVRYLGSTTGPSYNNDVCSPYQISWHVDRTCSHISASSMDHMCKVMLEDYAMEADVHPHGPRTLVDAAFVDAELHHE